MTSNESNDTQENYYIHNKVKTNFTQITNALHHASNIPAAARYFWTYLCRCSSNSFHMTQAKMVAITGMSKNQVTKAKSILNDHRMIHITEKAPLKKGNSIASHQIDVVDPSFWKNIEWTIDPMKDFHFPVDHGCSIIGKVDAVTFPAPKRGRTDVFQALKGAGHPGPKRGRKNGVFQALLGPNDNNKKENNNNNNNYPDDSTSPSDESSHLENELINLKEENKTKTKRRSLLDDPFYKTLKASTQADKRATDDANRIVTALESSIASNESTEIINPLESSKSLSSKYLVYFKRSGQFYSFPEIDRFWCQMIDRDLVEKAIDYLKSKHGGLNINVYEYAASAGLTNADAVDSLIKMIDSPQQLPESLPPLPEPEKTKLTEEEKRDRKIKIKLMSKIIGKSFLTEEERREAARLNLL